MNTKLGLSIQCSSAREQLLYLKEKNACMYYEDYFHSSMLPKIKEIIYSYIENDTAIELSAIEYASECGMVTNSILIKFYNRKGFDKKSMREDLQKYWDNYFMELFRSKSNLIIHNPKKVTG